MHANCQVQGKCQYIFLSDWGGALIRGWALFQGNTVFGFIHYFDFASSYSLLWLHIHYFDFAFWSRRGTVLGWVIRCYSLRNAVDIDSVLRKNWELFEWTAYVFIHCLDFKIYCQFHSFALFFPSNFRQDFVPQNFPATLSTKFFILRRKK